MALGEHFFLVGVSKKLGVEDVLAAAFDIQLATPRKEISESSANQLFTCANTTIWQAIEKSCVR